MTWHANKITAQPKRTKVTDASGKIFLNNVIGLQAQKKKSHRCIAKIFFYGKIFSKVTNIHGIINSIL